MQLGVLVDRAIDAHEQALRLERGEVRLEIERRSGGARSRRPARIGADVEHGRDLLVSPLTYDFWRLQFHAFGVSSAPALACFGHPTLGANDLGARVARLEDPTLLTGRGRFVDDIKLAGALHACFARSPHAHAAIRSIDASAARAMPGVHAVLTADDLPPRMANRQ